MAFVTREGGARLYWRPDGHPGKPALLLLNSLGTDHAMWDAVTPLLTRDFRVLRMDTRGHGASDAPAGDYSIAMLAADALAVLDAAGVKAAHVCGLSMGGMTALEMAATHPERVERIVGANTSPRMDADAMRERAALVRREGMAAVVDGVIGRFFTQGFRDRDPPCVATTRAPTILATDPQGYAGCCMAIATMEIEAKLAQVKAPLLVINGAHDVSAPPSAHGERIAAAVPGARSMTLDAGHLSAVEVPEAFAGAVLAFLQEKPGADLAAARGALFDAGLAVRRAVLGDAWVDKALASRDALTAEFQDFITRVAWGEIWTRPGLDQRTRRLLVLAITASLSRWDEFRLHLRAGAEQGALTREDVKEALLQIAVYAGVPAGNTGMHHAKEIFAALGKTEAAPQ